MTRFQKYYQALLALYPPGVYDESENSLHHDLVRADARALSDVGQDAVDQLALEIFPHTAEESLPEWEELYQISPPASATITERQAVVASRWKSSLSSSNSHLRAVLAPLLNPKRAFHDRCDDENVSFRYRKEPGSGIIGETTDELFLSCNTGDVCDWSDIDHQDCPKVSIPLVDEVDDVWFSARVRSFGTADGIAAGIALYKDAKNAICFEMERTSGDVRLRVWFILEGQINIFTASEAAPALPFWMQICRKDDLTSFRYGSSLSSLKSLMEMRGEGSLIAPDHGTLFALNKMSAGYPATYVGFDEVMLKHGQELNNVEIIETPLEVVPKDDYPEAIFVAYVHREPTDEGTYNLTEAQNALDRCKQGHSLILVGESDCFRCDDPSSLLDRDVFGS